MTQDQRALFTQRIGALLETHGWSRTDGAAVAKKTFPTAVGDKTAFVYLQNWPDQLFMQGSYYSEGRNILESWGDLIPFDVSQEVLETQVSRFVSNNERAVGNSYAARLLASRMNQENAPSKETQ
jgi:hypothetical protein